MKKIVILVIVLLFLVTPSAISLKNNLPLYGRIKDTRYKIEDQYNFYEMSELSAHGTRLYSEIAKVLRQLKEIDRLRVIAKNKGDEVLVTRLDNL